MAAFIEFTPFSTSSTFAALLGLRQSSTPGAQIPEGNEFARMTRMQLYLRRNRQESTEQQNVVWAKFCAHYLPATVERCLDLPSPADWDPNSVDDFLLDNAWMHMLLAVSYTPYFSRYIRSSSPVAVAGKHLPRIVAERFLILSSRLEHEIAKPSPDEPGRQQRYTFLAITSLALLATLLRLSRSEPSVIIGPQTASRLSSFLRRWKTRHRGSFLGTVSNRVHYLLSAKPQQDRPPPAADPVAKPARKFLSLCSLPSCQVKGTFQACGRCKTVRYCCIEHQREHWEHPDGEHKLSCHRTPY
ncbi:hypothetical protein DFH09DRAFT_1148480 [Mycena vulgaris]|nr:hypothetical protein DFH09DRAFT_1148480 [Mycena vulgaris]